MANRNFDHLQVLGKGIKEIAGSFAPNGTSSLDQTQVKGRGFSVLRTGVGTFTVTLQDKYVDLQSAHTDLALHAAGPNWAQFGDIDVVSAKTVVIRTVDGSGAAVDVAAQAFNRVHFTLKLRNSSVK